MSNIFKEYREFSAYDPCKTIYSDHTETTTCEQSFCPYCGGDVDIAFRCVNCGRQYHPIRSGSVTAPEGKE